MVPRIALICLVFGSSLGLVGPVVAAPTIGFYGDAAGTAGTLEIQAFVPATIYLVAKGLEADGFAVEFGASGDLADDVDLLVLDVTGPPPILLALDSCGRFACLFGFGSCIAAEDPFVIASWNVFAVADLGMDRTLCVEGFQPSTFPDGDPGYQTCDADLVAFLDATNPCGSGTPPGCLIVNPSFPCDAIPTVTRSFGAIKSLYGN